MSIKSITFLHSPLDYVEFGICTSLMNVLGIKEMIKYSTYKNKSFPGIGELEAPVAFEIFVERMRKELQEPIRVWRNNRKKVFRVGVLTGAGDSSDHIQFAVKNGCDTYVTGEANLYTIQYAKYLGINLLVGCHTFTEIYGVESLARNIQEMHADITIIKLHEEHLELNHLFSIMAG